ncbi:MAG: hypothetical protein QXV93_05025 [Zestosphaera sp.]
MSENVTRKHTRHEKVFPRKIRQNIEDIRGEGSKACVIQYHIILRK